MECLKSQVSRLGTETGDWKAMNGEDNEHERKQTAA